MLHYTKGPKRDHNFDNHPYSNPLTNLMSRFFLPGFRGAGAVGSDGIGSSGSVQGGVRISSQGVFKFLIVVVVFSKAMGELETVLASLFGPDESYETG